MSSEESTRIGSHGLCATQNAPITPNSDAQPNPSTSRTNSNSAYDSFFTAEDNTSNVSSETSRSIRKTRSAARTSSIFASSSSKDIGASSLVSSTPLRGRTGIHTKSSGTPHLDHVLSFHQKLSPPTFSQDIFTSFALEADSPSSHDSMISFLGNWRFYSSGSARAAGSELPATSSDDASLGDSDSSEEEHQVLLLPRPYSLPSVARSEPSLSAIKSTSPGQQGRPKLPYVISRKRSKSLSAIPAISSVYSRSDVFISASSKQDHVRALSINSSSEARHFARCSLDVSEADISMSSTTSFELVGSVKKSAKNGKRAILDPKSITKPLGKLQKAVNRLLS